MDTTVLVTLGQALLARLDETEFRPRFAMWYKSDESDRWRLWIVPFIDASNDKGNVQHAFYRKVATIMLEQPEVFGEVDASITEMMSERDPAIVALSRVLSIKGTSGVRFTGNVFNGFYLPDGIILRSDLFPQTSKAS